MDETWVEGVWSAMHDGQQVRLVPKDSTWPTIQGQVSGTVYFSYFNVRGLGLTQFQRQSYNLFVPARSAVTLPTEPGWYVDRQDDVWQLYAVDSWRCLSAIGATEDVEFYAPFVRLESVPDTARRVLTVYRDRWENSFTTEEAIRISAAEFGVTDL